MNVRRNSTPRVSPTLFHDIFFNLSISTDKLETRLQSGFQSLHFSFFSCWDPCVHIQLNKMAPIARKVVSLIRSKNAFIFELFFGQIKVFFFSIKFSGTSPSDHYYIIHFFLVIEHTWIGKK